VAVAERVHEARGVQGRDHVAGRAAGSRPPRAAATAR
jgi:hypothetical protein